MKKSKRESEKRKHYRRPRLVTYGDFRSLSGTQAKGGVRGDGGPQTPNSKL